MGRYNFNVYRNHARELHGLSDAQVGTIATVGFWVYAASLLINGPLAEKFGGRRAILIGVAGATVVNACIALFLRGSATDSNIVLGLSLLYGANMYFQSFGAISVVKVNSSWFHWRERGLIGGVFGSMISLGYYLALGIGGLVYAHLPYWALFVVPSCVLAVMLAVDSHRPRPRPPERGRTRRLRDRRRGRERWRKTLREPPSSRSRGVQLAPRVLAHPVLRVLALAEFCTGIVRQGLLLYYGRFLRDLHHVTETATPRPLPNGHSAGDHDGRNPRRAPLRHAVGQGIPDRAARPWPSSSIWARWPPSPRSAWQDHRTPPCFSSLSRACGSSASTGCSPGRRRWTSAASAPRGSNGNGAARWRAVPRKRLRRVRFGSVARQVQVGYLAVRAPPIFRSVGGASSMLRLWNARPGVAHGVKARKRALALSCHVARPLETMRSADLLAQIPLFQGLTDEDREALGRRLTEKAFKSWATSSSRRARRDVVDVRGAIGGGADLSAERRQESAAGRAEAGTCGPASTSASSPSSTTSPGARASARWSTRCSSSSRASSSPSTSDGRPRRL